MSSYGSSSPELYQDFETSYRFIEKWIALPSVVVVLLRKVWCVARASCADQIAMALYSALPNRIVLVAGFLACVLAEDCATNEVVSQWTRIGHCAGRTIEDRLDYTPASIMEMATLATRVRICTQGSPSDCVTSKSQTVIRYAFVSVPVTCVCHQTYFSWGLLTRWAMCSFQLRL